MRKYRLQYLIMTQANTPSLPPLYKDEQEKAVAYVFECEERVEKFNNFHWKLITWHSFHGYSFFNLEHTFQEYVIWEVRLKTCLARLHPADKKNIAVVKRRIRRNRGQCKRRCGATPKYHAILYYDMVNTIAISQGRFHYSVAFGYQLEAAKAYPYTVKYFL